MYDVVMARNSDKFALRMVPTAYVVTLFDNHWTGFITCPLMTDGQTEVRVKRGASGRIKVDWSILNNIIEKKWIKR